jgi:hypothetical protein
MPLQLSASLNLTGSINLSGSMSSTQVLSVTSSLALNSITSSYANLSSNSISSSYANLALNSISSSYATNYNYTISSSFASSSISSSYAITSSFANISSTASFALNAGTTLITGSTYPITSSWSNNSISSSYALTASFALNAGTTLTTGSTYPITSSWSNNSISSSYVLTASYALNGSGSGTILTTGSTYPITSSWSNNSNNSISSSYALTASFALNGGSGGTTLTTGSTYPITSSWSNNSISSSYALTASFALNGGGGGTTLTTGSTYPITSSWANNAITASYAITPVNIITASLQTGSIVNQTILYNVTTSQDNIITDLNLSSNKWSVSVVEEWNSGSIAGDDYYNSCSLLLHFSGSNNSTTFIDSSPVTKSLTSNNGAKITSSISKFGGSSLFLDGTDDYVTVANSTDFDFGSGDFTVEYWEYRTSSGTNSPILSRNTITYTPYLIGWNEVSSPTTIAMFMSSNGSSWDVASNVSMGTLTTNVWTHYAVTRQSNTFRTFKNGTLISSFTSSATFPAGSGTLQIGRFGTTYYFKGGYVDELRITKGVARYTGSFTTSSVEFQNNQGGPQNQTKYIGLIGGLNDSTVDYGVEKLSDSSLKIRKMSATGQPLSGSGILSASVDRVYVNVLDYTNVSVSASISNAVSSSYALTASYALNGGSGGGGTTLTTGSTYPITSSWSNNSVSSSYVLTASYALNSAGGGGGTTLTTGSTYPITSSWANNSISASFAPTNTNITASWSNNSLTASYNLNSVSSSYALTASYAITPVSIITASLQTGSIVSQTILYNVTTSQDNTISNLNLSSNKWGVSVIEEWNSGSIAGDDYYPSCSLLMHFSGSNGSTTFIDNSPVTKSFTVNGNSQISTVQSKFGNSSLYLDGTGDYLSTNSSNNFAFGTGDFTVEFWIYSSDVSSATQRGFLQTSDTSGGLKTSFTTGIIILQGSNNVGGSLNGGLNANVAGTTIGSSTAVITTNTWYHIALVRNSGTSTLYVNGISVGSGTTTGSCSGTYLSIGGYYNTSYLYQGYLDELRITKGVARYTGSFTTSSVEFENYQTLSQYATKYIGLVGGLNDSTVDYGVEKLSDSSLKIRKMTASGQPLSGSGILSASVDRVYVNVIDYTNVSVSASISNAVSSSYALTASYALNSSGGGTTLTTGSTYPITSSWANNVTSASYSLTASYALNGGSGGTTLTTGSTYPITASWSNNSISSSYVLTASYALNSSGGGTTLTTGSSYPITSSWSNNATSASYALNSGTTLTTGSTYPITSSWSNNSVSSSYAINSTSSSLSSTASYVLNSISASYSLTSSYSLNGGSGGTTLTTGSTYPITSSWANNVISSSYSLTSSNIVGGTTNYIPLWTNATSLGSSTIYQNSNNIGIGTTSPNNKLEVIGNISASSFTGSHLGTSSWANNVTSASYALTASFALNGGSGGGTTLTTGSTYPITSSWANNVTSASYVLTASYALNFPSTSSITGQTFTSDGTTVNYTLTQSVLNEDQILVVTDGVMQMRTGSYTVSGTTLTLTNAIESGSKIDVRYLIGNINTGGSGGTTLTTGSTYPITSSWSNNSITASFALNGGGTTLTTGSSYPITSSWSNNSITSSYALTSAPRTAIYRYGTTSVVNPGAYAYTIIKYDTSVTDSTGWYNNTTGSFKPTVAGWYQVSAGARVYSTATTEGYFILAKNGTDIGSTGGFGTVNGFISMLVYFNGSTDYIQLYSRTQNATTNAQSSDRTPFTMVYMTS